MAIRPILTYPDPRLTVPAAHVSLFEDPRVDVRPLITDLADTLYAYDGLGLAAPQLGVSLRVLVIDLAPRPGPRDLRVFVNPSIRDRGGVATEPTTEGCLSFPDVRLTVARSAWIRVHAQRPDGTLFLLETTGLLAVALQHEIDHLDGVLFIDRTSRQVRRAVQRQFK